MDLPLRTLILSLVSSVAVQALVVTVEPQAATVVQGDSVRYRCRARSSVQPVQLEWKRANNQAFPDNVKVGSDGSVLTVTNAQPGNQGQYRCVASSAEGQGSANAVLNVRSIPKIQLTPTGPLRVRAGDSVSVECRATGRPRPTVSWLRPDSSRIRRVTDETSDVHTLKWEAIRPEDSGVYSCLAVNKVGEVTATVEVIAKGPSGAPVASVDIEEMTVVEGQTVRMECQARGSPTPVISWSKLRAPLPWKHEVTDGVLILTNVGRQDSGQYICNATNIHGYSEAYTQMEVDTPPYATCLPELVRLQPGQALAVNCLAHGSHPITFTWSRVGRPSLPASAEARPDGQLLISRVKQGDSGTYKCVATNHVGSSEATLEVIVKA